jgi:hypothetical protein
MGKRRSKPQRRRKPPAPVDGYSVLCGADGCVWRPGDAAADVAAIDKDRARFAALPGLVSYVRPPEPGELRAMIPPGCDLVAVEVYQIKPGVRIRRPSFRTLEPFEIH